MSYKPMPNPPEDMTELRGLDLNDSFKYNFDRIEEDIAFLNKIGFLGDMTAIQPELNYVPTGASFRVSETGTPSNPKFFGNTFTEVPGGSLWRCNVPVAEATDTNPAFVPMVLPSETEFSLQKLFSLREGLSLNLLPLFLLMRLLNGSRMTVLLV